MITVDPKLLNKEKELSRRASSSAKMIGIDQPKSSVQQAEPREIEPQDATLGDTVGEDEQDLAGDYEAKYTLKYDPRILFREEPHLRKLLEDKEAQDAMLEKLGLEMFILPEPDMPDQFMSCKPWKGAIKKPDNAPPVN